MITIRKSDRRGQASHGWLDSRHTFSFANYYDPEHMGVSHLRVINEDRVAPGGGFAPHSHRDMEIISYVLSGALEHKDSMGNSAIIRPGEVQRMSAGSGVTHSEYNASQTEPVHFLQIWIMPNQTSIAPGYQQTFYADAEKRGRLRLVASSDGRDGSVTVHQDAALYATLLGNGETVSHRIVAGRVGYLQLTQGSLLINGERLDAGDGATITADDSTSLSLTLAGIATDRPAEALLFDLAAN